MAVKTVNVEFITLIVTPHHYHRVPILNCFKITK